MLTFVFKPKGTESAAYHTLTDQHLPPSMQAHNCGQHQCEQPACGPGAPIYATGCTVLRATCPYCTPGYISSTHTPLPNNYGCHLRCARAQARGPLLDHSLHLNHHSFRKAHRVLVAFSLVPGLVVKDGAFLVAQTMLGGDYSLCHLNMMVLTCSTLQL
jgi:hypothetical protein